MLCLRFKPGISQIYVNFVMAKLASLCINESRTVFTWTIHSLGIKFSLRITSAKIVYQQKFRSLNGITSDTTL
jgi:hypothetical protein